jgi:1-acyl-sn-glycerol-3-phosphate acyltransferase
MRGQELFARSVTRGLLGKGDRERLDRLAFPDAGHGYDVLGMHRDWVGAGLLACRFLYERWFRVRSYGAHHIPKSGSAILAANHSGVYPLDATMLYVDVLRHTEPPRAPRPVFDLFVGLLPFLGTAFARVGATPGTRRNFRYLLESGELLMVFPEGAHAIGKDYRDRYKLHPFRVGHAELAIRHRAPIVPVGIIGPEEQWPLRVRFDSFHVMGAPFLPLPLFPIPLPVRYHIHYGEPIRLHERYRPEQADDPAVTEAAADEVQAAVQRLIDGGLRARKGLFR